MNETFLEFYVEVKDRIKAFWEKYPQGRIITGIIQLDSADVDQRMVTVMAELYADSTDERPFATGLSKEREGTQGANKTAFLENAETSAIGRALANAGFLTDKRPSREEMEAVKRREEEHAVALEQIKRFAKKDPNKKKEIEPIWGKLKEDPTYAISYAHELSSSDNG